MIERWRTYLDRSRRTPTRVFAAVARVFAALPETEFAAQSPAIAARIAANNDPQQPQHPRVAALFKEPPATLAEVARRYGELFTSIEQQWQDRAGHGGADGPGRAARFRRRGNGRAAPACSTGPTRRARRSAPRDVEFLVGRPGQAEITALRPRLKNGTPGATRLSAGHDSGRVAEFGPLRPAHFCPRPVQPIGRQRPSPISARFPVTTVSPFQPGRSRLELAQAIATRDNPLTARVMVNRVWSTILALAWCATPSDFGLRSEPPSHPELLDGWPANSWTRMVDQAAHQLIVLSSDVPAIQRRPARTPSASIQKIACCGG